MLRLLKSATAVLAFVAMTLPNVSHAQALSDRDAYRLELNALFEMMDTYYGPLQIKKTTIGLDWPAYRQSFAAKVDSLTSSNDFYFLVSDVLNSLNDAHVALELPSTLVWSLPMQFSTVENAIIVSYYNSTQMLAQKCSVAIGDELKTIGGKTVDEVQATQPVFAKDGNPITNKAYFARMLTSLNEARGVRLAPFGPTIAFGFVSARTGAPYSCNLTYKADGMGLIDRSISNSINSNLITKNMVGEMIGSMSPERYQFEQDLDALLAKDNNILKLSQADRDKIYAVVSILNQSHALMNLSTPLDPSIDGATPGTDNSDPGGVGSKITLGQQNPYFKLPPDFKRIEFPALGALLNEDAYFAGTFQHNGKTVGFLRIPSYEPTVIYTMPLGLNYIMGKLKDTDYLILDQTNNPGGMVAYSDMVIKSLTGLYDISKHMRFVVKPTQGYLGQFALLISTIENDTTGMIPAEAKALLPDLKANYETIHTAYVNHMPLSEPVSMLDTTKFLEIVLNNLYSAIPLRKVVEQYLGAQVFEPQTYEFPVYMMINELDFSGGDATPAGLQDYGRVKLVGVRTAGAGGSVEEFRNTITSDYKYHLTTSLMLRKGGKYVENYGVTPDIAVPLTKSDVIDSYTNVLNKVLKAVDSQSNNVAK